MFFTSLFSRGRFPQEAKAWLAGEDALLAVERVKGSITWINYRAPDRISTWRRQWFRGSLIATDVRFAAFRGASRLINIPFDDGRWHDVDVAMESADTLLINHDAGLFRDETHGTLEYRFWVDAKTDADTLPT